MTAFRSAVLEHFKHPRNRGPLDEANASEDGANPLCGDRIRVQLRVIDGVIADARFTADACALCIASASIMTDHVHGMSVDEATRLEISVIHLKLYIYYIYYSILGRVASFRIDGIRDNLRLLASIRKSDGHRKAREL